MKVAVSVVAPEESRINEFFTLEFNITSLNTEPMDLKAIVDNADGFMVCGEAEPRVKLPPGGLTSLKIQVVGLKVGFLQLPGLKLTDMKSREKDEVLKSVYNTYIRVHQGQADLINA